MNPLLSLRDIAIAFPSGFALACGRLDLEAGSVTAVVGQNGAGKSVLLRIAAGLADPDSGSRHTGFPPDAPGPGLVWHPQHPSFFANLSVAENLAFPRLPGRRGMPFLMDPVRLYQDCHELFRDLDIDLRPGQSMGLLGYAQKSLVAVLGACHSGARVLVLDEPTAAMGEPERRAFFRMVRHLRDSGSAILFSTHRLEDIPAIADRILVIRDGEVMARELPGATGREALISLMSGRPCPLRFPRTRRSPGEVRLSVEGLRSGEVLRDVNFQVRAGEIVGLAGFMGTGRSRLASCIFGQLKPDAGTIRLDRGGACRDPADAVRRGIALIPEDRQDQGLFHHLDLVRNMTAAALGRFRQGPGLDTAYMEELSDQYAENLGICRIGGDQPIHTYSGGNQQKVVLARWLMCLSKVYLMDEPTRGLDPASRIDIYNAMNDLASKGAAILLVSSDLEELMGLCDRVLVLAGGTIRADLPWNKVTKEDILRLADLPD